ncbi:hypothetical protein [Leifsonia sp. NPDC058248]|uniref:hypothetical protein n=1 Tax=Leifsonia sp. NPDC058248 TaxID=3346402 RepID=UPI0036D7C1C2
MANFANSPERFTHGALTLIRDSRGTYDVTIEGIVGNIATVTPYAGGQFGWLHLESGQSGRGSELRAAAQAILEIEATRTD